MKHYRAAFLTLCVFFTTFSAHAATGDEKNLKGRLGIGYTSQMATTTLGRLPAIDAKYYLSRAFAVSGGVGFNTRRDGSAFGIGLKAYRNVFTETNLMFYLGAGLAYVNNKGSNLQPGLFLGSEFFFYQLPSLGFSFEAGIHGDSSSGSFALVTTGDSFLNAGMHFYF